MERIRLSKEEKAVFRSVSINGKKLPLNCSPFLFVTTLDLLKEKGLVSYKADEDGVVYMAKLTIKGKAYMEYNPHVEKPYPVERHHIDCAFNDYCRIYAACIVCRVYLIK